MALRFTVLASGSSGNASLVEADGFGLLLDAGIGPRMLGERLATVGRSWQSIHAVLLTHTHGDHWNERTLAHLLRRAVPIWCHAEHRPGLRSWSATAFALLESAQLVREYEAGREFAVFEGLRCRPFRVRHDSGATFGFRLEGEPDLFGQPSVMAYAADLGTWGPELAREMSNVDLLALEFNHDVAMEYASGRSSHLIARVLGDEGHLSNEQAAALLREVLRVSAPGRLRHLVQLHLSRDCNRPALALAAARTVLSAWPAPVEVYIASQHEPCPTLHVGYGPAGQKRRAPRTRKMASPETVKVSHPLFPGFE